MMIPTRAMVLPLDAGLHMPRKVKTAAGGDKAEGRFPMKRHPATVHESPPNGK